MATPAPTVSAPVSVTEAAAPPSITLEATTPSLPSTGGDPGLHGTAVLPDGTTVHLLLNGADTGVSATVSGGTYPFVYNVPANATANAVTLTFTAST